MPQHDPFVSFQRGLESPASEHFSITPQDGADLPVRPRVLYVNASGVLAVRDHLGAIIEYSVSQGQVLPFSAAGVEASGTTAVVVGWL